MTAAEIVWWALLLANAALTMALLRTQRAALRAATNYGYAVALMELLYRAREHGDYERVANHQLHLARCHDFDAYARGALLEAARAGAPDTPKDVT